MNTIDVMKQAIDLLHPVIDARVITALREAIRHEEVQPGCVTVQAAADQLAESLCQSKGWMRAYAAARVNDAIEGSEEAQTVEPVMIQLRTRGGTWRESDGGNEKARKLIQDYPGVYESRELFTRPTPPTTGEREALITECRSASSNAFTTINREFYSKIADMLTADAQEIERLETLSVTNIMVDVASGWDGAGQEIYAKSTDEVVNLLTDLSEKLDYAQQVAVPQGLTYDLTDAEIKAVVVTTAGEIYGIDETLYTDADAVFYGKVVRTALAARPPQVDAKTCAWTYDGEGYYVTGCDKAFTFNDGTPAQNSAYFCHCCGGKLEVKP